MAFPLAFCPGVKHGVNTGRIHMQTLRAIAAEEDFREVRTKETTYRRKTYGSDVLGQ